ILCSLGRPQRSPLFPYTTLFRSHDRLAIALEDDLTQKIVQTRAKGVLIDISSLEIVDSFMGRMLDNIAAVSRILDVVEHAPHERSEEHTSELQSRENLVCRLLLE